MEKTYRRNDCNPNRYHANTATTGNTFIARSYGNSTIGLSYSPIRPNHPRTGREELVTIRR